MKATFLLAAGLFLASVSCERHSWNEVKALHEEHEGGAAEEGHEGAEHAEAAPAHGEHAAEKEAH